MAGLRINLLIVLIALGVCQSAEGGTVVAWGDNSFGETNVPAGLSNVIAVGATYENNFGQQPPTGYYNTVDPSWPACHDTTTNMDTIACFSNTGMNGRIVVVAVSIVHRITGGCYRRTNLSRRC